MGLVPSSFCHIFLDDGSDSELSLITFNTHSRTRSFQERQPTQEIISMKNLSRGEKPSSFDYQSYTSQEERVGGSRRVALRPKPLFHVVDEERESGGESEEEASAIGSRWSTEHRHRRDYHRFHSPLLQKK